MFVNLKKARSRRRSQPRLLITLRIRDAIFRITRVTLDLHALRRALLLTWPRLTGDNLLVRFVIVY